MSFFCRPNPGEDTERNRHGGPECTTSGEIDIVPVARYKTAYSGYEQDLHKNEHEDNESTERIELHFTYLSLYRYRHIIQQH